MSGPLPQDAVRVIVSGRVQGVGFRAHAARSARALGLRGFVRNLEDGTVESAAAGAPDALAAYLAALREGPPGARVSGLSVEACAPEAIAEPEFQVR